MVWKRGAYHKTARASFKVGLFGRRDYSTPDIKRKKEKKDI